MLFTLHANALKRNKEIKLIWLVLSYLTCLSEKFRSSSAQLHFKIDIQKTLSKSTEKNMDWSLFLVKLYTCTKQLY